MEAQLRSRMGLDIFVDDIPELRHSGEVDDWYVTFEWSEGGIVHAHMALWVAGAPRMDKIEAPREQAGGWRGGDRNVAAWSRCCATGRGYGPPGLILGPHVHRIQCGKSLEP